MNYYEKMCKLTGITPREVKKEDESSHYVKKLRKISEDAIAIADFLDGSSITNLEYWIQDKIVIAEHNMDAVRNYMVSED
jgi:hypothetical protein